MGQLVCFWEVGYAVDITHRHGNAKPPAGSFYLTQGVRPAGRYLDYSARRKIADGERMHAAQELFMEYGSLSFAYRLLVGFPRFFARLSNSLEDATVNIRLKAKECGVDGNGQAEESFDSRRLVVTERSLGFHNGQPAAERYADVHGDKHCRVRSGILAGPIYERCDGVDHFGRR